MSVRLADIDLSSVSSQMAINTLNMQLAQCGWIEFLNESPYTVELALGGLNIPIPAWYDYPIQLQQKSGGYWTPIGGINFPPMITPVLLANNLTSNVSTKLLTTLYLTGETPAVTTPQPLVRQTYIPNTVNNVSGTASAIQNDGNASGTSVVEATPSGASSSSVSLLNQGVLQLGQNVSAESGEITLLDAAGSAFNGIYQGGKATIPGGITANLMTAQASNDIGFHVATGQQVVDTINGVNVFTRNSGGAVLLAGTFKFLVGSISRISMFSGSCGTTTTAFNHGLGVVPDIILIQVLGTVSSVHTVLYDNTTMTTTQVNLTSNFSNNSFVALAIKF